MLTISSSSSCDICFETFQPNASSTDDVRHPSSLPCGHVFCTPCINALGNLICPTCRSPFDRYSVRALYVPIDPPSDSQAPRDRPAPENINLFQQFTSAVAAGSYASSTSNCTTITAAIKAFTDGFVAKFANNTPSSGGGSGSPVNMVDQPRGFASAFTAFDAKGGVIAIHWGVTNLVVPSSSSTGSGASSGTVAVTFDVHATTVMGENIYITGSVGALKNWSPKNALLLSAAKYPIWSITINLPANTPIQYKYIRKYKGSTTWERDPNKRMTTPSSDTYTVKDDWRGLR